MDLLSALQVALDAKIHANSKAFQTAKQSFEKVCQSNESTIISSASTSASTSTSRARLLSQALVVINGYGEHRSSNDFVLVQFICERANEANSSKELRRGLRLCEWFVLQHPRAALLEFSEFLRILTTDLELEESGKNRDILIRHCMELARRSMDALDVKLSSECKQQRQRQQQQQQQQPNLNFAAGAQSNTTAPKQAKLSSEYKQQREEAIEEAVEEEGEQQQQQQQQQQGQTTSPPAAAQTVTPAQISQTPNSTTSDTFPAHILQQHLLSLISWHSISSPLAFDATNCFVSTLRTSATWIRLHANNPINRTQFWQSCDLLKTLDTILHQTKSTVSQLHPLFSTAFSDLVALVSEFKQSRASGTALTARAMADNIAVTFAGFSVTQCDVTEFRTPSKSIVTDSDIGLVDSVHAIDSGVDKKGKTKSKPSPESVSQFTQRLTDLHSLVVGSSQSGMLIDDEEERELNLYACAVVARMHFRALLLSLVSLSGAADILLLDNAQTLLGVCLRALALPDNGLHRMAGKVVGTVVKSLLAEGEEEEKEVEENRRSEEVKTLDTLVDGLTSLLCATDAVSAAAIEFIAELVIQAPQFLLHRIVTLASTSRTTTLHTLHTPSSTTTQISNNSTQSESNPNVVSPTNAIAVVSAVIGRLATADVDDHNIGGANSSNQNIKDRVGFMCLLCDVLIPWLDNPSLSLRNAAARAIAILGPFHALPRLCAHGLGPTSNVSLRAATTKAIVEVLVGCDSVNQQAMKVRTNADMLVGRGSVNGGIKDVDTESNDYRGNGGIEYVSTNGSLENGGFKDVSTDDNGHIGGDGFFRDEYTQRDEDERTNRAVTMFLECLQDPPLVSDILMNAPSGMKKQEVNVLSPADIGPTYMNNVLNENWMRIEKEEKEMKEAIQSRLLDATSLWVAAMPESRWSAAAQAVIQRLFAAPQEPNLVVVLRKTSELLSHRLETVALPMVLHQLVTLPKLGSTSDERSKDILERLLFARLAPLLVLVVIQPSAYANCLSPLSAREFKNDVDLDAKLPSRRLQFLYTCVVNAVVDIVVAKYEFPRVRQLAAQVLARFDSDTTFRVSTALLSNVCKRNDKSDVQFDILRASVPHLPKVEFNSEEWGRALWFLSPTVTCELESQTADLTRGSDVRSANAAVFTLLTTIIMLRSATDQGNTQTIPCQLFNDLVEVLKIPVSLAAVATESSDDSNAGLINLQQGCVECLSQLVSWSAASTWSHTLTKPRVLVEQVDAEAEPLYKVQNTTHDSEHISKTTSNADFRHISKTVSEEDGRHMPKTASNGIRNVEQMLPQEAAKRVIELMSTQPPGTKTTTATVLSICACNALIRSLKALAMDAQLNVGNNQQTNQAKPDVSVTRAPRLGVIALVAKVLPPLGPSIARSVSNMHACGARLQLAFFVCYMLGSVLAKDTHVDIVNLDIMHDINALTGAILSVLGYGSFEDEDIHAIHLAALKALGAMLSLPAVVLDGALSTALRAKVHRQVQELANMGTGVDVRELAQRLLHALRD